MDTTNLDYSFKITLLGDSPTGKTCFLVRLVEDVFESTNRSTFPGVDYKIKTFSIDGKTIKVQFWDTAGQEKCRQVTMAYCRGCSGIFLFYNIAKRQSFDGLPRWLEGIRNTAGENTLLMLIGMGCDLESHRAVPFEEASQFAEQENLMYMEASAKDGTNIKEAVLKMIEGILSKNPPSS